LARKKDDLFKDRALVGTALDLVEEDVAGPTELGCGAEVVEAAGGSDHSRVEPAPRVSPAMDPLGIKRVVQTGL
jgi:hypothetical protein